MMVPSSAMSHMVSTMVSMMPSSAMSHMVSTMVSTMPSSAMSHMVSTMPSSAMSHMVGTTLTGRLACSRQHVQPQCRSSCAALTPCSNPRAMLPERIQKACPASGAPRGSLCVRAVRLLRSQGAGHPRAHPLVVVEHLRGGGAQGVVSRPGPLLRPAGHRHRPAPTDRHAAHAADGKRGGGNTCTYKNAQPMQVCDVQTPVVANTCVAMQSMHEGKQAWQGEGRCRRAGQVGQRAPHSEQASHFAHSEQASRFAHGLHGAGCVVRHKCMARGEEGNRQACAWHSLPRTDVRHAPMQGHRQHVQIGTMASVTQYHTLIHLPPPPQHTHAFARAHVPRCTTEAQTHAGACMSATASTARQKIHSRGSSNKKRLMQHHQRQTQHHKHLRGIIVLQPYNCRPTELEHICPPAAGRVASLSLRHLLRLWWWGSLLGLQG